MRTTRENHHKTNVSFQLDLQHCLLLSLLLSFSFFSSILQRCPILIRLPTSLFFLTTQVKSYTKQVRVNEKTPFNVLQSNPQPLASVAGYSTLFCSQRERNASTYLKPLPPPVPSEIWHCYHQCPLKHPGTDISLPVKMLVNAAMAHIPLASFQSWFCPRFWRVC